MIERVKEVPIIDIARELGINIDSNNKALCFNGHDTAPSLSFNTNGNYFKCFGCGAGGSGIDLVMQTRQATTREAISWIENQFNLAGDLPRRTQKPLETKAPQAQKREGGTYSAIYKDLLDLCDPQGAVAYLQGRGIGREISERAGIRVAPRGIEKALIEKHVMAALLASGVMAISSKSGEPYYTLFNTRLIIPYRDRTGSRITNLQGRNIDSDQGAKYQLLKGIETTPYNLEALDQGKTLYLCEGALDALSCYQLGLRAPIAFPGVQSFKEDYFDLLEPYELIVAGDIDHAGEAFYRHLKKGYLARGKKIYHLDYTTLKAAYGVKGEAKDLNDIARQADYQHQEESKPIRVYSHTAGEAYTVLDNVGILFDSGLEYDKEELQLLLDSKCTPERLDVLHQIKKNVNGRLVSWTTA
jgi:DNA primase